jgi:hypothetical protein
MSREPLRFNTAIVAADGTPTQQFQRMWEQLLAARAPVITPLPSQQPQDRGTLVIEATSDTSLTFRYKGSDGVVRSASLTLT